MSCLPSQTLRSGLLLPAARFDIFASAGFIHPWVIGGYWTLPLQYIQNAIAINELTGGVFYPALLSALLCRVMPCPALPCPDQPYPAVPCRALPCPALPCPALPCPALPCPALPCPALPRLALPCGALPCIWPKIHSCNFCIKAALASSCVYVLYTRPLHVQSQLHRCTRAVSVLGTPPLTVHIMC